jgi:hypothetical protein
VAGVGCELRRWETVSVENISPMTGRVNDLVTKAGASSTNGVELHLLLKKTSAGSGQPPPPTPAKRSVQRSIDNVDDI